MATPGQAIEKAVEVLLEPVRDILQKLLGPAASEIGFSLGDAVRVWRFRRVLIFLADVKRIIHAAGFEPNSVAPHLLFPILEAASLQEDEELQDRWACLLANAARPGRADDVLPSFVEVLKQLSPFEAQCLKKLIEEVGRDEGRRQRLNLNFGQEHQIAPLMMGSPVTLAGGGGNPEGLRRFRLALSSLLRLGLIERRVKQPHGPMGLPLNPTDLLEEYWLTEFGHRFLRVCEPPRPA